MGTTETPSPAPVPAGPAKPNAHGSLYFQVLAGILLGALLGVLMWAPIAFVLWSCFGR